MTHRLHRDQRRVGSALLGATVASALVLATAAFAGISNVQAQACSPQIGIDTPAPGDTVAGTVTFSGWALDLTAPGGSGVDQVRLYRDAPPEQGGTPLAVATVGGARPDIDAANNLTNSNSGWTATVDFTESPAGAATIYIYAHTICGWTYATQVVSVDSSNLAAPAPAPAPSGPSIVITLDAPMAGAIVNNGQALTVSGWAVDSSGAGTGVDAVRLFLDGPEGAGQPLGFANYGRSRTDVANASGNPSWEKSGFDLVWAISGVSPGSHVLYIYAHSTATGQWDYTTVPVTVTSAGVTPPQGTAATPAQGSTATSATAPVNPNAVVRIEAPSGTAPITGPTVVRGYALDCATGQPANVVRFYAGTNTSGNLLGTVTVGSSPRDLATVCPGRGLTGSTNAGFTFNIDPQTLGGAQSITVAADTMSGPSTATLAFGGGATTAGTTDRVACTAAAAINPFATSCSPAGGTTTITNNTSANTTPNPSSTSSSYTVCLPNQPNTMNTNPYMATSNAYQSQMLNNSANCVPAPSTNTAGSVACNPSYPTPNPNYPNNVPCTAGTTTTASYNTPYTNTGYNNMNPGYNAYSSYNSVNYPTTQYNNPYYSSNYPYTTTTYPYNNTNYYGSGYNYNPYANNAQYGYPYNSYNYGNYNYGNPYGNYGAPYYGSNNLAYQPGYYPNYVYNGNAGANYGPYGPNPYGSNPYGYNPYGAPYGYPSYGYPY